MVNFCEMVKSMNSNSLNSINKIFYNWELVWFTCVHLSDNIKRSNKNYKHILYVPKGGMIPASILAYYLNISELYSVDAGLSYNELNELFGIEANGIEEWLLFDDVCDTGETFKKFTMNNKLDTAALVYKDYSNYTPTFVGCTDNRWIVFPWELDR